MQLDQFSTAPVAIHFRGRAREGKQLLPQLLVEKIQVEIVLVKLSHRPFVVEIVDRFLVAITDLYEVGRQLVADLASRSIEEILEIAAVSPDRLAQLGQFFKRLEDVFQLRGRDFLVVGEIFQTSRPRRLSEIRILFSCTSSSTYSSRFLRLI